MHPMSAPMPPGDCLWRGAQLLCMPALPGAPALPLQRTVAIDARVALALQKAQMCKKQAWSPGTRVVFINTLTACSAWNPIRCLPCLQACAGW